MKWILYITIILMCVGIVGAINMCPEQVELTNTPCRMISPAINCTSFTYDIINLSDNSFGIANGSLSQVQDHIYEFNFTFGEGEYLVRLCDQSIRSVKVKTPPDKMASMAIMLFVLLTAIGLFILPFFKKDFYRGRDEFTNAWVNKIIRTGMWIIAIHLMMLNSAIAATISEVNGLGLSQEMFRYMWLFGVAGWITTIVLVLTSLLSIFKLWKINKDKERMTA